MLASLPGFYRSARRLLDTAPDAMSRRSVSSCAPGGYRPVLHRPPGDTAGLGHLVVSPGAGQRLPGALPVCSSSTTTACCQLTRSPMLADGDRRLGDLRAADRQAAQLGPDRSRRCGRYAAVDGGLEVADADGETAVFDCRRDRHARRPGAGPAGGSDRAPNATCSVRSPTPSSEATLHTDGSMLPRPPGAQVILELPAARLRRRGRPRSRSATT